MFSRITRMTFLAAAASLLLSGPLAVAQDKQDQSCAELENSVFVWYTAIDSATSTAPISVIAARRNRFCERNRSTVEMPHAMTTKKQNVGTKKARSI